MKWLLTFAVVLMLVGCKTTESRFKRVTPGMTRTEVVQILGQPKTTSDVKGVEILNYNIRETINDWYTIPYYVRLKDGIVIDAGRRGTYPGAIQ